MIPKVIAGFDPADTKEITLTKKVEITPTKFTVKSDGVDVARYTLNAGTDFGLSTLPDFDGESNITKVDDIVESVVGFYTSTGALQGFTTTDHVALKYQGYFYATGSGFARMEFKACGFGYLLLDISGRRPLNNTGTGYCELRSDGYEYGVIELPANSWYTFTVQYFNTDAEAGFSLLYRDEVLANKFVPVSAGFLCRNTGRTTTSDAGFLSATELPHISDSGLSIQRNEGDVSTMSFNLPLVISGGTTALTNKDEGYYYNSYWNKWQHVRSGIQLNDFDMIECSIGYEGDYTKVFSGQIKSITANRRMNEDSLTVHCEDWGSFYKESINLNYPDKLDYWNAGYCGSSYSATSPDGDGYPHTYDGWRIDKAFDSLAIRAGIDSTLLLKKRQFLDANNTAIDGGLMIEAGSPRNIYLDTPFHYGGTTIDISDEGYTEPDDEYIIESNFGDFLFDYTNKIVDTHGMDWGTAPYYDGAPYLRSRNNPSSLQLANESNQLFQAWDTTNRDIRCIGGLYYESNAQHGYIEFHFTGRKIALAIVGGEDSGAAGTIQPGSTTTSLGVTGSTFSTGERVIIEMPDGTTESSTLGTRTATNGYDVFDLDSTLTQTPFIGGFVRRATFRARVRRGQSWDNWQELVDDVYGSCYYANSNSKVIRTGLSTNQDQSVDSLRYYYEGLDPDTSENPCLVNLQDDLSYDHYVVRITRLSNEEAGATNYLRVNALFVYEDTPERIVEAYHTGDSFAVSGTVIELDAEDNVMDQRNDVIIVGRQTGTRVPGGVAATALNPNNPTYDYVTSRAIDNSSIGDPSVTNYAGRPLQTIQIASELGSQEIADYWAINFIKRYRKPERNATYQAIGNPLLEIGDCITVSDDEKDTMGTQHKLWVTGIESDVDKYFYVDKISTTTYPPVESYSPKPPVDLAEFNGKPIDNVRLSNNGTKTAPYNPYDSDAIGKYVTIKFDLLADSYVRIDVMSTQGGGIRVATLLNSTATGSSKGWEKLDAGANYVITWDGIDTYGTWNESMSKDSESYEGVIGAGYYVNIPSNVLGVEYGEFYLRFHTKKRHGQNYDVQTSKDGRDNIPSTDPDDWLSSSENGDSDDQYIYVNPGERTALVFSIDRSYKKHDHESPGHAQRHVGDQRTLYQNAFFSFENPTDIRDENSGRGLKMLIRPIEEFKNRYLDINIKFVPYVFGHRYNAFLYSELYMIHGLGGSSENAAFGDPFDAPVAGFEETYDHRELSQTVAWRYAGVLNDDKFLYFNPTTYGYDWDDFRNTFSAYGDNVKGFYIAWLFKIIITVRDKSGRICGVFDTLAEWTASQDPTDGIGDDTRNYIYDQQAYDDSDGDWGWGTSPINALGGSIQKNERLVQWIGMSRSDWIAINDIPDYGGIEGVAVDEFYKSQAYYWNDDGSVNDTEGLKYAWFGFCWDGSMNKTPYWGGIPLDGAYGRYSGPFHVRAGVWGMRVYPAILDKPRANNILD